MIIRRAIALVLVAIAVGFALYRCSYVPLKCSRDAWRSEKELLAAAERVDSYYKVVAARNSLDRLQNCDSRPLDVNRPVLIALSYRFLQQHPQSILWYQRALSVDRRPEIYLGLGIEQARAQHRQEGIESLALAVAFAPTMLEAIDDPILSEDVKKRVAEKYGPEWMR